jgi:hypothetical protein
MAFITVWFRNYVITNESIDREPEFKKNETLKCRILLAFSVAHKYQERTQRINWSHMHSYRQVHVQRNLRWPTFRIGLEISCPQWRPYPNDAWCSFFGSIAVFPSKLSSFVHALPLFTGCLCLCLFCYFWFEWFGSSSTTFWNDSRQNL